MYNKKNTFTGIKVDDLYAKGYIPIFYSFNSAKGAYLLYL